MLEISMLWGRIKTERREAPQETMPHRQEILLHRQRHLRLLLDGLVQSADMSTILESSARNVEQPKKKTGPALIADIQGIRESSVQNAVIKKNRV